MAITAVVHAGVRVRWVIYILVCKWPQLVYYCFLLRTCMSSGLRNETDNILFVSFKSHYVMMKEEHKEIVNAGQ